MPKKGGKKSKASKTKSGAAASSAVTSDAQISQAEEIINKMEGEVESAVGAVETVTGPTAKTPAAAPPEITEEDSETASASLPETEDNTIQDTVDKAQASKAGRIGTMDGDEVEEPIVLPESTVKESNSVSVDVDTSDVTPADVVPENETSSVVDVTKGADRATAPAAESEDVQGSKTTHEEVPFGHEPSEVSKVGDDIGADKVTAPVEQSEEAAQSSRATHEEALFGHEPSEVPKVEDNIGAEATSLGTTPGASAKVVPTEAAIVGSLDREDKGKEAKVKEADSGSADPIALGDRQEVLAAPKPLSVKSNANEAESLGTTAASVGGKSHVEETGAGLQSKDVQLEAAQADLAAKDSTAAEEDGAKEETETEAAKETKAPERDEEPSQPQSEEVNKGERKVAEEPANKTAEVPAGKAADKIQKEDTKKAEHKKGGFLGWIKRKLKGDSK